MLQLKHISKTYRPKRGVKVTALDDVTIDFPDRGLVFIVGKSGCGKSTLLNVCGGLDRADSGEIVITGRSSKDFKPSDFDSYRNTYIGFVFQEYNILNEMTVEDNISVALELQGGERDREKVDEILKIVELEGYAKRKPSTLSGGQKQRVAIARALIKNPRIILADEPTGALDSETGKQVLDMLKKLSEDKLVIIVSHDVEFAERYADRIIELKDGTVISDRTPVSGPPPQERQYTEEDRAMIGSRLPVRHAFRMGASVVKTKPVRLAFTILLCIVAFVMFGVFSALMFYSQRGITVNTILASDIGYLRYQKAYRADCTSYLTSANGETRLYSTYSTVLLTGMSDEDYAALNEVYGPSVAVIDDAFTVDWYYIGEYGGEFYTSLFSGLAFTDDDSAVEMLAGNMPEGTGQAAISDFMFEGMMSVGITDGDGNIITLEDYGDYIKLPALTVFGMTVQISGVYAADDAAANKKNSLWFDEVNRGFYTYLLVDRPFVQEYIAFTAQNNGDSEEDAAQQVGSYFTFVYDSKYVASGNDYITGVFIPRSVFVNCVKSIVDSTFTVNDDDSTALLTNYLMSAVRSLHSVVRELQNIFLGLWLGFTLFAALLMGNFISASIAAKRREISILRAIGARSLDVFKIFLFESLIVAAVCLVLSSVCCAALCPVLSTLISSALPVDVLVFTPLTLLFMALVAALTAAAATAVPVAIYSEKPPIDSIRAL